jgi:hypothetical protein
VIHVLNTVPTRKEFSELVPIWGVWWRHKPHTRSDSEEYWFHLSRHVNFQNNRYWPEDDIVVGIWCATGSARSIFLLKP